MRLKPLMGKIKTLGQADLALKEIGLLERELESIDKAAHQQIAEIKSEAAKKGENIRKRISDDAGLLCTYAAYNKDVLFKDKRSVQLSFGTFGYRRSTCIRVKETTLKLLEKLKLDRYIRIKKEPDKEAMSNMDDDVLAQVDSTREVNDDFFYKADKGEINKELLKEQTA